MKITRDDLMFYVGMFRRESFSSFQRNIKRDGLSKRECSDLTNRVKRVVKHYDIESAKEGCYCD